MTFKWTLSFIVLTTVSLLALSKTEDIRLNQVGFYPDGPKMAIVVESSAEDFFITTPDLQDTLFHGSLRASQTWPYSEESVRQADFSDLDTTGTFVLLVPGMGYSAPFDIKPRVHQEVARAAIKAFYFQRMSMELTKEFAGKWARPMGHPDTEVLVHASAASAERPEGTILSSPRGWYDAGDYNKYIVNSGISTYTLLSIYEHFPEYAASLETTIPESGDTVPDVLDEALWNIRWMLTMQDPNDGGVYHKCTHANFSGIIMPHQATAPRYVVQKSSTAALNFAAVMAQSARIFRDFESEFPGLADSCLTAALAAWEWARLYPGTYYRQNDNNATFQPSITTGEYGDWDDADEFRWAAAELYVTTQQDSFVTAVNPLSGTFSVPSWRHVETLGLYSLAHHRQHLTSKMDTTAIKNQIIRLADNLTSELAKSAYHVMMTNFPWGSNAVAANQSMAALQAFRITADSSYLQAAITNLDYLLGRNATTYCFVSDFGAKPPMHFHHRPSEADDVVAPVPGLLAGGPNPSQQDNCSGYPSDLPAKSYVDDWCSYASNEICINWNSPLAYIASAIEALKSPNGRSNKLSINITTPIKGATFETGESITIAVDATVDEGDIKKVEFYADHVKIGESAEKPYELEWTLSTPGVYDVTAKAIGDLGDFRISEPVRFIVVNSESIGSLLFITGSRELETGDLAIYEHLIQNDYNIVVQPDDDSLLFAMDEKDAILVSVSAAATRKVRNELENINVPIVSWEPTLFDDFNWTGRRKNVYYGFEHGSVIDILNDSHPIAAGLSGKVEMTSEAHEITWAVPNDNATLIACLEDDPSKPVIFCYETGTIMMDYITAKSRQVGLFFAESSPAIFTENAWMIFRSAIQWATAGERLDVDERLSGLPKTHQLYQNYPNPFNPQTTVRYALSRDTDVSLTIYNALGRRVRTLVAEPQVAGIHTVAWDGVDAMNKNVGNGLYFITMRADDVVQTRKMVLMR